MFFKTLPGRVYWFGLIFLIGIGVAFYLLIGRGAKMSVTDELLMKQQLLVRAERSNIESFFEVFGDSVAVLSRLKMITSPASAIWDLGVFVEQWRDSGLVDGVALTDARGAVQLNSNVEDVGGGVGVSLADRDYFLWAKNEAKIGDYFVGRPVISRLGASKGRYIVPVASPVYQSSIFSGVLVAAVDLEKLTEENLANLKVSPETDVFLMDQGGHLYYSNSFSTGIGSDIFDLLEKTPFQGSQALADDLKDALEATSGGRRSVSYLDPQSSRVENHALAYSPVNLGSQKWLLVMASPIRDIWSFNVPMYIRIVVLILFVSVTIVMFGIVAVRETQKRLK